MAERFQNPVLLKILHVVSRLLDNVFFFPFHALIQAAHLTITRPVLRTYLRLKDPTIDDVRLRRSVTTWRTYHFLLSDVDLTVIVRKEPADSRALCDLLERCRKAVPFLGEFEIYTIEELAQKNHLESKLGFFAEFIRDLRKLSWMPDEVRPYHRLKRERAVKKIQRRVTETLQPDDQGQTLLSREWTQVAGPQPAAVTLDERTLLRIESILHEPGLHYLQSQQRYHGLLQLLPLALIESAYDSISTGNLWLALWLAQHERIVAHARCRIVTDQKEIFSLQRFVAELDTEIHRCKTELEGRKAPPAKETNTY